MFTILTKNGRLHGNGIVYDININSDLDTVFLIEDDFGEKYQLVHEVLRERFHLGEWIDYDEWRTKRLKNVGLTLYSGGALSLSVGDFQRALSKPFSLRD